MQIILGTIQGNQNRLVLQLMKNLENTTDISPLLPEIQMAKDDNSSVSGSILIRCKVWMMNSNITLS